MVRTIDSSRHLCPPSLTHSLTHSPTLCCLADLPDIPGLSSPPLREQLDEIPPESDFWDQGIYDPSMFEQQAASRIGSC